MKDFSSLIHRDKTEPAAREETPGHLEQAKLKSLSSNGFPHVRMRRLRKTPALRNMVRETALSPHDLISPLFIEENSGERSEVPSMPGVFRETEKSIGAVVKETAAAGVQAVMLFGVSHNKDTVGSDSLDPNGLLSRMIDRAKQAAPETTIIADLCFCEYTNHGHCGPLNKQGDVENDATIENIAMQAVIAAEAGADMVAPSGMMDGQVSAIRHALDVTGFTHIPVMACMMDGQVSAIRHALDVTGFTHIPVMAYAAKFASCYYGPFRDAAGCSLENSNQGNSDRKTYQLDPANGRQAIRDALLDEKEGADILMVKPGIAYLDILTRLRDKTDLPLAAYQVSGEYAMLKYAAQAGALNYEQAIMESLMAFKRAGADLVLTYSALEAARLLQHQ